MQKINISGVEYVTPYNTIYDEIALCEPMVQAYIELKEQEMVTYDILVENLCCALENIFEKHNIPMMDEITEDIIEARKFLDRDLLGNNDK